MSTRQYFFDFFSFDIELRLTEVCCNAFASYNNSTIRHNGKCIYTRNSTIYFLKAVSSNHILVLYLRFRLIRVFQWEFTTFTIVSIIEFCKSSIFPGKCIDWLCSTHNQTLLIRLNESRHLTSTPYTLFDSLCFVWPISFALIYLHLVFVYINDHKSRQCLLG